MNVRYKTVVANVQFSGRLPFAPSSYDIKDI
jgi:hypothetical protein